MEFKNAIYVLTNIQCVWMIWPESNSGISVWISLISQILSNIATLGEVQMSFAHASVDNTSLGETITTITLVDIPWVTYYYLP